MKAPIILIIAIYSCSFFSGKQENNIRGFKITENFPLINDKGKVLRYDTFSTNIYYYKNQVLYYSSYHFDSTANDILITSEKRHYYFVYTKGKRYGYKYDKHKGIFEIKGLIDSSLNNEWTSKISFSPILSGSKMTQRIRSYNSDSGILNVEYTIKGINDTSMSGIFSLWFNDKIKGIDYSLSSELDSMNNAKLCKVRILNNPRYIKEYNFSLEKIEQAFDLEEIKIKNEKELLYYFERNEKQQL